MKKDHIRDYVTEMFRTYAAAGEPTYDDERQRIYSEALQRYALSIPPEAVQRAEQEVANQTAYLMDILAVSKTMEIFERGEKKHIAKAVRAVYFMKPKEPVQRGDIMSRVVKYALMCPAEERTVYRWLREARKLCAAIRGLKI